VKTVNSRKLRVAIATEAEKGLDDTVSEVFGRANTFTIIDFEEEKVKGVTVLQNKVKSYKQGSGPLMVKTLTDLGVNVVMAREFGPGASTLLSLNNISAFMVRHGMSVIEAIKLYRESLSS
jgi:predicted Fe-Mo cluster-binding NifX family protein